MTPNLWKSKESTYKDETIDGQRQISGNTIYNGIIYTFHINEQLTKSAPYLYRGEVVMRSPHDGKRAELHGKERRGVIERITSKQSENTVPPEKHESLVIRKSIYLHDASPESVKTAIEKAVLSLYEQYGNTSNSALRKIMLAQLSPEQLLHLHLENYVNTKGTITDRTRQRTRKALRDVYMLLATHRVIGDITPRDLEKIIPALGYDPMSKIRQASYYWDYCVYRAAQHLDNPFEAFLRTHKSQKTKTSPHKIVKKALTLKSLPEDVERNLNDIIHTADCSDAKITNVLLIKETGLPPKRCKTITWGNIIWDDLKHPVSATLRLQLDDLGGATHDRAVPLSRFATSELWRRYQNAKATVKGKSLQKTPILLTKGKLPTDKELTAVCRTVLLQAGIGKNNLVPDRTEPYGVGVRLLISNYRYRLNYICGIQDEGTIRYLMMRSLANCVTDDHYRCYTDADGQHFLRGSILRDGRFASLPKRSIEIKSNDDGTKTTIIPPDDANRLTSAHIEYVLKPGEEILITSDYGFSGSCTASRTRNSSLPKSRA